MNFFWLLRAKRWAQNPPSAKMVMLVIGIIAFCLALYGLEYFYGPFFDDDILRQNRRMPNF
ncbi:hypothetical protein [Yoonia sp. 208BN28-4]|uniref:hypothetical protein n=1 Tax=Yoonia sp. 208BN28-4 TaxID=3126505 RepID=UPI003097FD9C